MVLASLVLVGGLAAALVFHFRTRAAPQSARRSRNLPPDPRLAYSGPFTNIHPEVAYVGDKACTPCHKEIAASYRRHPMAQSLQPIAAAVDRDRYDRASQNPFDALHYRFFVDRRGAEVEHTITFADVPDQEPIALKLPVHFVIGSGTHGRSYLLNRNGYLFQSPISWFSNRQFWNLSPGFNEETLSGRPVHGSCLFCHANRAHYQEGSRNRYRTPIIDGPSIGCERCHGPGARHVETSSKWDIVNPAARDGDAHKFVLSPALRDAVCEQCHLEGEQRIARRGRGLFDFRPGLSLEDFYTVFVTAAADGEHRAVSHVEQMHQSRCYQKTRDDNKLGCVSCHDPHVYVPPAEQAAHYRDRCLGCHSCSVAEAERRRQQSDDSCIACHMPSFQASDIAHAAATDHRIPRRRADSKKPRAFGGRLVPFTRARTPDDSTELARDLGLALAQSLLQPGHGSPPQEREVIALLETALRNDPDDVLAWSAKGVALMRRGQAEPALAAFRTALALEPENENALFGAAVLTQQVGSREDSLQRWRRLVAVNPELSLYRRDFALLLEQSQRWDEARDQCRDWLRLEPNSVPARRLWISLLLQQGNKEEARREFARLSALKPANLAELHRHFAKQLE